MPPLRRIFAAASFKLHAGRVPVTTKGGISMLRKPFLSMLGAAVLTLASAGVFAQAIIVAPHAPPPPRMEVVPAARPGYVWDPGHWRWNHGTYMWAPGHWQPVRAGYRWIPGHWVARGPNWRWVPGHWA
jgi:hypothetical protein